jgi:ketosteroid isomerase-like protein
MRRWSIFVTVPFLVFLAAPTGVTGQEATPAGVACAVEPRSPDELLALWYDPSGSPVAILLPAASPPASIEGEAVDAETAATVDAVVQEWAACYNAGDTLRALALLTDDLVRRQGPQDGATRDETQAALESEPIPPAELLIVSLVGELGVLEDGRVGGSYAFGDPQQTSTVVFIVLRDVDGRWLIDDMTGAEPLSEATPAA